MKLDALPVFPRFRDLNITDKDLIDQISGENFSSELTFSSLYSWRIDSPNQISRLGNDIVLKVCDLTSGGNNLWLVSDSEEFEQNVSKILDTDEFEFIEVLGYDLIKYKERLNGNYSIKEDIGNFEYVTCVSDLAQLNGHKFKDLRYNLNLFDNIWGDLVTIQAEKFTNALEKEILRLYKRWSLTKIINNEQDYEKEALIRMLDQTQILDCEILTARENGKLVGAGILEYFPRHKSAVIRFLKTDSKYRGLTAKLVLAMNQLSAKCGIEYVNHEEDLNKEHIRAYKKKFRPAFFVEKYRVYK